ncbi:MAG: nucleotide exchange factor GrpE [Pseudomonadota bacterium]
MSDTNKTQPGAPEANPAESVAPDPGTDPATDGVEPVDEAIAGGGGAPDLAPDTDGDVETEPAASSAGLDGAAEAEALYDAAAEATAESLAGAAEAAEEALAFEQDPRDDEIAALTAEREQLKDKLMRALAEAENVRRRAERDRKDAEAYGGTKLARDLLSVHDNLERALASADEALREQHAAFVEGVDLTLRELVNAFAKHKIEKTVPEKGEKFDPNLHQAMFEAPIPGAEPGTVIEVMTVGFTISGRLLRPAMVGVARAAG